MSWVFVCEEYYSLGLVEVKFVIQVSADLTQKLRVYISISVKKKQIGKLFNYYSKCDFLTFESEVTDMALGYADLHCRPGQVSTSLVKYLQAGSKSLCMTIKQFLVKLSLLAPLYVPPQFTCLLDFLLHKYIKYMPLCVHMCIFVYIIPFSFICSQL